MTKFKNSQEAFQDMLRSSFNTELNERLEHANQFSCKILQFVTF